jgi:pyrroloquinoline quinone biosynthesis protein B
LAWAGDLRVRPRTQTSLAVSGDGESWVLINASPDLPQQVRQTSALHPCSGTRGSPIKAIVLTGAEVDQAAGVLSLREREAFTLYATPATHAALADNAMFAVLAPDLVIREAVLPEQALALPGGLQAQLFMVPGKVPLYMEGEDPETAGETAANVGVELARGDARIAFIPGAAAITPAMRERIADADVVFFDGTLFCDDEMMTSGTGSKTGRRMGHMPIAGEGGSLAALDGLRARRIYLHINNTNPILIDGSPQRREVERHGWEVAEDGMKIVL